MTYLLKSLLALFAASAFAIAANAQSTYATKLNGFKGFDGYTISNGCMQITNTCCEPQIALAADTLSTYRFKAVARLANLHNKENKSYSYTGTDGKKQKTKNPVWGIVFGYLSPTDYFAVELQCANTMPHDLLDKRYMDCRIVQCSNGQRAILGSCTLSKNINLHSGENLMCVSYSNGIASVSIGESRLTEVLSASITLPENSKAGILCGSGAAISMERFVIKQDEDPQKAVLTTWTKSAIDSHFMQSEDIVEGYWKYLDRDIDDTKVKLGGNYTVALIKTNDGYDIIYIDGAETYAEKWQTGFLKGRLIKTRFIDHYDLIWYDSTFRPFTHDVSATVENAAILKLSFPVQKSQIRLYKTK